jgi:pSer/pThr/pTyr-binding forkhead associated (FHA) protein
MAYLTDPLKPGFQRALPGLESATVVIGREAPADLVFELAPISRKHAEVLFYDGRHWLRDLGSRNGTFKNGSSVGSEPVRLIDGDEIVLGGAVALRFHDPSQTVKGERVGRLKGVWIDDKTSDVYVDSVRVDPPLSAAQSTLLGLIYKAEGQVISRDEIVVNVWPSDDPKGVSEEALDGLIKRLRARLREAQPNADYVEIVRGRGVRLRQE